MKRLALLVCLIGCGRSDLSEMREVSPAEEVRPAEVDAVVVVGVDAGVACETLSHHPVAANPCAYAPPNTFPCSTALAVRIDGVLVAASVARIQCSSDPARSIVWIQPTSGVCSPDWAVEACEK